MAMANLTPRDMLSIQMPALFSWAPQGDLQRIRTPYLYPDGDEIDLFLKAGPNGLFVVTDLGETLRWLRSQTLAARRTTKQNALLEDICLTHGVELFKGMLTARCHPGVALAAVITRLAQACLRVSDLWFTFRTRAVESVTDEVGDFLAERHLPFDRNEKLLGRSGRPWTINFHVRAPVRSSLVMVLSTGSRSGARISSEHVLATWHDLNHLVAGPEGLHFISLFDDTLDVWTETDFRLLDNLSTVCRWSEPDVFTEALDEAA
jgi:hypothetical protein